MKKITNFISENTEVINYTLYSICAVFAFIAFIINFKTNITASHWAFISLIWIINSGLNFWISKEWRKLSKKSLDGWEKSNDLLFDLLLKKEEFKVEDIPIATDDEAMKKSVPLPEDVKEGEAY